MAEPTNIVILYQSRSGNTRNAALATGERLADAGNRVSVRSVEAYNIKEMAQADLVMLGTWTDGAVLLGQRPGQLGKFKKLPSLEGKRVALFCTCKFWPGSTIPKFTKWAEAEGATVVAGLGIKKTEIDAGSKELAAAVDDAMARV